MWDKLFNCYIQFNPFKISILKYIRGCDQYKILRKFSVYTNLIVIMLNGGRQGSFIVIREVVLLVSFAIGVGGGDIRCYSRV